MPSSRSTTQGGLFRVPATAPAFGSSTSVDTKARLKSTDGPIPVLVGRSKKYTVSLDQVPSNHRVWESWSRFEASHRASSIRNRVEKPTP